MKSMLKMIASLFDPKQQWRLIGLGLGMVGLEELIYGVYSLLFIGCGDVLFLLLAASWLLVGVVCTVGGFLIAFGPPAPNPKATALEDPK